jgi:CHAT domain-containing protein
MTLLALVNLARTYAAQGDLAHAIEYQKRYDSALEKNIDLNIAVGSEREKLEYLSGASEQTDRTISLHIRQAPENEEACELAALVLLQRHGRVLDVLSASHAALRQRLNPQDGQLLDELDQTNAKLARLALSGPGKTPAAERQERIADLQQQTDKLEFEISGRSAEFQAQTQVVTLSAVRAVIPPGAALIEFAAYRPFYPKSENEEEAYGEARYVAYVIRREGKIGWRDLGSTKETDAEIIALREALSDPRRRDVKALARSLDQRLTQPLRELTGDATQLLIAPDGALNLVPFEALMDEHKHYLIERYAISYLGSGRDLLRMQIARASKSVPLVIANPFFGAASEPKLVARAGARRSITTARDLSGVYFAPLAGTALEARSIKSLFPEANVLTGREATVAALKQADAPRILHIATHGFFLEPDTTNPLHVTESQNPLLRSGLALADSNVNRQGARDGILTALEASGLNLWGTRLVTLSACDSGIGEVKNGEGVYGLRRAFVLAGAETLVMSLWPVSDYVTRELMTNYYEGLQKGLGRGEALRQAQLATLRREGRQHPFYWASFIQSGDWRNLDGK